MHWVHYDRATVDHVHNPDDSHDFKLKFGTVKVHVREKDAHER